MVSRVDLEPGYVLHRREYRDTSYLLDVWTAHYGRVTLVARGARGLRGRFHGLRAFQRLLLSWSGRGEMGTLNAAEFDGPICQLTGKWAISGFYLNELLMLLVHKHDPHADLFSYYERAVNNLARLKQHPLDMASGEQLLLLEEQKILRLFEKWMLEALGYGIHFEVEAGSGADIKADAWYEFDVEHGFKTAGMHARTVFWGENLLSYGQENLDNPAVLKDAKQLMRIALNYHLDGKVLKSRELRIAIEREKSKKAGSI